ncbi:MAG: glycosyltransferase family 2 protein [Patescibacteria group bacterium]|nr:glycosyltransferase family 2 protein [Patescibacteria group bacterium]
MLSVVIPIYNEEKSLGKLYDRLTKTLSKIDEEYEIIAVNDGSSDDSLRVLKKLHKQDSRFKVVDFRRNFGQTAALAAGFDYAQGDVVVSIDADLENDPNDVPKLLDKLDEGYDIVSGWRQNRWVGGLLQKIVRRVPSEIANFLVRRVTGLELHDTGCTLKAYRAEVLEHVELYGEMHRFVPAIATRYGAKIAEVPVNYQPREFGSSKYGFSRTVRVLLDLVLLKFLLGYGTRPIQFFGLLGVVLGGLGFVFSLYLTYVKFGLNQSIGQRPLLLLAVLLMVLGVQFVTMGLLGEIVMRTYFESQNKKIYAVREFLD